MGNFSVVGVILAYMDAPIEFRRFGVNPFPPSVGREVHAELLGLVASGTIAGVGACQPVHVSLTRCTTSCSRSSAAGRIRPVIGRRIAMRDVAAALEDHEARRTSGRTVVDISLR